MVYANIIHTKQLLSHRACAFSGLGQHMSYDRRATALKQSLKPHCVLVHQLLGLLFMYSRHGTDSQATTGLLNVCATGCDKIASNQL